MQAQWIAGLAILATLAGCSAPEPALRYACEARGESFRYRDGLRRPEPDHAVIRFGLTLQGRPQGYVIDEHPAIPELRNPRIVFDVSRSTPVESVYLFDATDAASGMRTVSSLVIHTVSGDVRLFHHRWKPPVEWRDSDQFMYTGVCRRTSA